MVVVAAWTTTGAAMAAVTTVAAGAMTRTAAGTAAGATALAATAAGELDGKALAHKVGAVEGGDDVAGVHGVAVLDEAEAVHELDVEDLAGAMFVKVALDVGSGDCCGGGG